MNQTDKFYDPLEEVGTITQSMIHRSANRPLKLLTNEGSKIQKCQCCNQPIEQPDIVIPFKFCEKIENYSSIGIGIKLYFDFYQFAIIMMVFMFCIVTLPEFFMTRGVFNEIIDYCKLQPNPLPENQKQCSNYTDLNFSVLSFNGNIISAFTYDIYYKYRMFFTEVNTDNSSFNKDDLDTISVLKVSFVITIFLLIFWCFFLILINAKATEADILDNSPGDYTVLIDNIYGISSEMNDYCLKENIPEDTPFKDKLTQFVMKELLQFDNQWGINEINVCHKMNTLYNFEKDKNLLQRKLYRLEHNDKQLILNHAKGFSKENGTFVYIEGFLCCKKHTSKQELLKQLDDINSEIKKEIEIADDYEKSFGGSIFISFELIEYQEAFLKKYLKSQLHQFGLIIKRFAFLFYGCCLNEARRNKLRLLYTIQNHGAPEPKDVIWENLEFFANNKMLRVFLVYLLTIVIMTISLVCVCALNYLQFIADQDLLSNNEFKNTIISFVISLCISLLINILNEIFYTIMKTITQFEKKKSKTAYDLSFSLKLTIFTFFNTGLAPYLGYILWDDNNLNNLLKSYLIIFVMNSVVSPCLWLFNPMFICRYFLIFLVKRRLKNNPNYYTQKELNDLYELPDMSLSFKYSYIARTLLMTAFYATFFPVGILISLLGLFLGYFVEKWNIHYLYKRPEIPNEKITQFYFGMFKMVIIAFCLGNLILMNDVNINSKGWYITNWILCCVILIFPFGKVFSFNVLGIAESETNNEKFSSQKGIFESDYESENPLNCKIVKIKEYQRELREKRITQEEYEKKMKELDKLNNMEVYYNTRQEIDNPLRKLIIEENKVALCNIGSGLLKDVLLKYGFDVTVQRTKTMTNNNRNDNANGNDVIEEESIEIPKENIMNNNGITKYEFNNISSDNSNNDINSSNLLSKLDVNSIYAMMHHIPTIINNTSTEFKDDHNQNNNNICRSLNKYFTFKAKTDANINENPLSNKETIIWNNETNNENNYGNK